jgi:hypothetical protein
MIARFASKHCASQHLGRLAVGLLAEVCGHGTLIHDHQDRRGEIVSICANEK